MTDTRDPRRIVLVTGCSSGIGRAVALGLPNDRYRVFASVRNPIHRSELEHSGLDTLTLDLASSESIHQAVEQMLTATGGRIHGLVNNGAYGQPGAIEDLGRDALRAQFEVNLFGTHELTRALIPVMRRQACGRIIQISSILGRICLANRGAYNASKYALEAISDTMRLELHGSKVHVSLIEPGPIESRFRANALNAFRRHIDPCESVHESLYRAVLERLSASGNAPFTLPAESVLKPVLHALQSENPRARYPLTVPARVLPALKRFLSDGVMDAILRRVGDKPAR